MTIAMIKQKSDEIALKESKNRLDISRNARLILKTKLERVQLKAEKIEIALLKADEEVKMNRRELKMKIACSQSVEEQFCKAADTSDIEVDENEDEDEDEDEDEEDMEEEDQAVQVDEKQDKRLLAQHEDKGKVTVEEDSLTEEDNSFELSKDGDSNHKKDVTEVQGKVLVPDSEEDFARQGQSKEDAGKGNAKGNGKGTSELTSDLDSDDLFRIDERRKGIKAAPAKDQNYIRVDWDGKEQISFGQKIGLLKPVTPGGSTQEGAAWRMMNEDEIGKY